MSNTPNYNLYLTDDSSTRFQEWRNQMNGTENSNMVKIDAALGEKANSSVAINTTLLASAWNAGQQTVAIEGMTADTDGVVGISQLISDAELEAVKSAELYVCGQGDGTLTIAAFGDVPTCDIPIVVILLH